MFIKDTAYVIGVGEIGKHVRRIHHGCQRPRLVAPVSRRGPCGPRGLDYMEIKCPKCTHSFEFEETGDTMTCPHCNAFLEVAHAETGFMLVGVDEEARQDRPVLEQEVEDPVTEDYARWRTRAVFCILFGGVCGVILFLSIAHGMLGFGAYFFKSGKNQLFIAVLFLLSFCCIGGGAWLFRYLGKEREKYLGSDFHREGHEEHEEI